MTKAIKAKRLNEIPSHVQQRRLALGTKTEFNENHKFVSRKV